MKDTKHVGILCYFPFPDGFAATARIIAYSKGLVEQGVEVDVLIFRPTDNNSSLPSYGEISGVKYHYPNSRNWSKYKIVRVFIDRLRTLIITYRNILKMNKENKFDFIFISTDNLVSLFFFIPLLRLARIKVIFITDELPKPVRVHHKVKVPYYRRFLFNIVFRGICGYIMMTELLKDFYNSILIRRTFILPTLVDMSRFKNTKDNNHKTDQIKYLCYMGNMELSKDNVDNIIKAFDIIKDEYSDIKLFLYGNPSVEDKNTLSNIINELSLQERVILKGKANYNEVPSILKNAYILVSCQPNSQRIKGGLSTKLGEYIASGTPALFTDYGEKSQYFKDNEHVFFSPSNDPVIYSQYLIKIIGNYENALKVAAKGSEFIQANYDVNILTKRMKSFLDS